MHGMSQFVCLLTDKSLFTVLTESVKEIDSQQSWLEKTVILSQWDDMTRFLKEIRPPSDSEETFVPLTDDLSYPLKPEVVNNLLDAGLEIVGSNICQGIDPLNAEEIRDEYLRGVYTLPKWEAFFFNDTDNIPKRFPHFILKRDIVENIVNEVKKIANEPYKCVVLKELLHQSGAGASTVVMSAMWECRKWLKCVRINCEPFAENAHLPEKMQFFSSNLLFLRKQGEPKDVVNGTSKCKPVFVILDNTTEKIAKALRQSLEDQVREEQIKYRSTMFIVLYTVRKFDINLKKENPLDKFVLKQKLSDHEKIIFKKKLEEFNEVGRSNFKRTNTFDFTQILEFVIMACDFQGSPYITKVVEKSLSGIREAFPNQEQLLLYLVVFKSFSGCGLPVSFCQKIVDGRETPTNPQKLENFLATLSPQVRMFLRERNCNFKIYSKNSIETKSCKVLEVTFEMIAKELFNFLKKDKKLSDVLLDFVSEPAIKDEKFQDLIHTNLRMLMGKLHFFPLIQGNNNSLMRGNMGLGLF